MKCFSFGFVLLTAFALWVSTAISNPPVRIAILDSPIDYDHPQIAAVLDEDLLRNIRLTDEYGVEKTWYRLNLEAKAEFERRLDKYSYQQQIEFLDALNVMHAKTRPTTPEERLRTLGRVVKGLFRYAYSAKFRSQLNLTGTYLHGTHVAGISIESLKDVRLINLPILGVSESLKLSEVLRFDPENFRTSMRRNYAHISDVLKKNNVRVVNLSIGSMPSAVVKGLKKKAGIFARLALSSIYRTKVKELATTTVQIMIEEMTAFARQNPQAVFVIAAGNEKRDLEKGEIHTGQIQEPNVVQVASLNHDGARSPFSNWSANHVEIAAIGSGVLGALVGGGSIHLSGTSMATPKVTNALAKIFLESPLLSAADALQVLYEKHSVTDPRLAQVTAGGRKLIEAAANPGQTLNEELTLTALDEDSIRQLLTTYTDKVKGDVTKLVLTVLVNGKSIGKVTFVRNGSNVETNVENIDLHTCEKNLAG